MTWTCPFCERDYPDSGIGLPNDADAYEKTHCTVCAVDPNAIIDRIESWRAGHPDELSLTEWGDGMMKGYRYAADDLEKLLDDPKR